jgi:hypothetical protein
MKELLIVFFVITVIIMAMAFPFKTRLMFHTNLLNAKGFYSFKIMKIKLLTGRFYIDDVMQQAYQVVEYDGNYYFISDYNLLATNCTLYLVDGFVADHNLTAGYYSFDENGVMVPTTGVINGYLYVNGVMQHAYQVVDIDGVRYFVGDYNRVATNCTLYLGDNFVAKHNLPAGYYTFGADGAMIASTGVINGYLYVDGIMQRAYKVVKVDDDYYFVSDYNKIATNCTLYLGDGFVANTDLTAGYYNFDADGKMTILGDF